MTYNRQKTKECSNHHNFRDLCNALEHNSAFVAHHLHEPVKGAPLYKETYFKEKIKTANVALVVCLNMDIDPPDVQKIPPFSRVEAWVDPCDAGFRVVEMIGKNLQSQYERWQPKACYRQCLDPNLEDVKKLCINFRRNTRNDRILFHYNGHGVPRPTENGEIWVFNKSFTKYIPVSLYDLQRWLGGPSVYVIDCQNAGRVLKLFEYFCQRRQTEMLNAADNGTGGVQQNAVPNALGTPHSSQPNPLAAAASVAAPVVTMENTIMLCACQENEDLPQLAELPADLFTSCLTTPIRTALKWHWMKYNRHFPGYISEELLDRIPGQPGNRMSLLGEINWMFTAVTDTIAWCSFPVEIFQKLFRQDLLVASIYRNYLLAERLMRAFGCHPCSWPQLKPTHNHHMWKAWDHSLDLLFHHLPKVLRVLDANPHGDLELPVITAAGPRSSGCRRRRASKLQQNQPQGSLSTNDAPAELMQLAGENTAQLSALLQEADKLIQRRQNHRQHHQQRRTPPGYEMVANNHSKSTRSRRTAVGVGDDQKTRPPPPSQPPTICTPSAAPPPPNQSMGAPFSRVPKFVIEIASTSGGGGGAELPRISEETSSASEPQPPLDVSATAGSKAAHVHVDEQEEGEEKQGSEESDFSYTDDSEEDDEEEEEDSPEEGEVVPPQAHSPPALQPTQPSVSSRPAIPDAEQQLPRQRPLMLTATRTVRSGLYAVGATNASTTSSAAVAGDPPSDTRLPVNQQRLVDYALPTPPFPKNHQHQQPLEDYRPANFFTTQMTAFQAWLGQSRASNAWSAVTNDNSTDQKHQRLTATQLPILLQVLLSQTHRIRALLLLSEFLDLGPWAVSHCITVGILPYIVRLFNSNVPEVKPHLVFIWAKIIASAHIEFSRLEGMRDSGYRYFMLCLHNQPLQESTSGSCLSPLIQTMAAFALAKMLVKADSGAPEPIFQQTYCSPEQSHALAFVPTAADVLVKCGLSLEMRHLKLWLLLGMGRSWFRSDEARWQALRRVGDLTDTVLFPFLNDPSPLVRAAAVFALGTLIDNYPTDERNKRDAEVLSQTTGLQLVAKARDPSPLVRCELVVALCSFIYMCEPILLEHANNAMADILSKATREEQEDSTASGDLDNSCYIAPTSTCTWRHLSSSVSEVPSLLESINNANTTSNAARHVSTIVGPLGSPSGSAASALLRGMLGGGGARSISRSQRELHHNTTAPSVPIDISSLLPPAVQHIQTSDSSPSTPGFTGDLPSVMSETIFSRLWNTIVTLANDPHPTVSRLANIMFMYIIKKVIMNRNLCPGYEARKKPLNVARSQDEPSVEM